MTEKSRKIKMRRSICLVLLIQYLVATAFVMFLFVFDYRNTIVTDDIIFYYNDDYEKISDANQYNAAVRGSKSYIPKYETFEYEQYVTGFYVQDGSAAVSSTTFVLELQFPSLEEYNQFSLYEYSRFNYDEKSKVYHNGYECRITWDENVTSFVNNYAKMPYRCGILCQNEEYLTVRYVYYYDIEGILDKNLKNVFYQTYCDW